MIVAGVGGSVLEMRNMMVWLLLRATATKGMFATRSSVRVLLLTRVALG